MANLGAELKRPRSSGPTLNARNVRPKFGSTGHGGEYTDEDHNALRRVATLFGKSVQALLEQHKPTSSITMTDDDVSTSINGSSRQEDTDSFERNIPGLTRRSHHHSDSESSNAPSGPDTFIAGSGPESTILPWLSSCPSMEQEAGFSFPNNEDFFDQPLLDGLELGVLQNPNIWPEIGLDDWMLQNNTLSSPVSKTAYESELSKAPGSASSFPLFECDTSFLPHLISSYSVETGTPISADSPNVKSESRSPSDDGQRRNSTGTRAKRRGPYRDAEARRRTWQTRINKACVRCSMQRIRVSRPL